jgi:hypothetical protein
LKTEYRFAHQGHDILLGEGDLRRPFLTGPSTEHPSLTLLDYFLSIEQFVFQDEGRSLLHALQHQLKRNVSLDEIRRMVIRSEKHGALHHVCRVELFSATESVPLAIYAAVTEKGRNSLAREFETLNRLNRSLSHSFLPAVYSMGEWLHPTRHPDTELLFVLAEWLEGYHEWHFHRAEGEGTYILCIWDLQGGYRYASPEERFEIFRQAAKILSLYYDVASASQIHPWSHAAGDFVVRCTDKGLDVKLSSARGYGPILRLDGSEKFEPLIAIIYFLLDLSIGMRLDRCEGTGEVVWAEKQDLAATIKGFLDGMALKDEGQRALLGPARDLAAFLKVFAPDELLKLCLHLKEAYAHVDSETLTVISQNLEPHCEELCRIIREAPRGGPWTSSAAL